MSHLRSRSVGGRLGIVTATYAFAVTMLATTLPTPLYELYRQQFGFSELMVTLIFATYAVGVIASLVLFGRLSDAVGRRVMLLAGLVLSAVGMIAFLVAQDVELLFVGRLVSGLSAGIFTGTATAALIDLMPPQQGGRATLISTFAQMGGLALGPLLSGALADLVGAPLRVPYWVALALLAPALVGVWAMPEPGHADGRVRLRPQPLEVPAQARAVFAPAALAAFAAFAVLGLFTALSPAVLEYELAVTSSAVVGAVVFAVFAAATAGELFLGRVSGRAGLLAGSATLIAGLAFLALSLAQASLALLAIGGVIAGFGLGLSFRAGLTEVTSATPAPQRGEVASAFFVVAYGALAVPVIGVGLLADLAGLRTAGLLFTAVVAAIAAAAVALISWQTADRRDRRTATGVPSRQPS